MADTVAAQLGRGMSAPQIVGVFVRVLAIWLVFLAVRIVGLGLALNRDVVEGHAREPYVLALLFIVCAVLLWRFALFVANRLLPRGEASPPVAADAIGTVTVALIVLGLWLAVAQAVPLLIRYMTVLLVMVHREIPMTSMDARSISSLCEGIIELLLASFLVLRARSVAGYLLQRQF